MSLRRRCSERRKAWMAGSSPAMTESGWVDLYESLQ